MFDLQIPIVKFGYRDPTKDACGVVLAKADARAEGSAAGFFLPPAWRFLFGLQIRFVQGCGTVAGYCSASRKEAADARVFVCGRPERRGAHDRRHRIPIAVSLLARGTHS